MVTTLDMELQQAAYAALGDRRGAVIAMEPDTGKILAMVSKPGYDQIPFFRTGRLLLTVPITRGSW